MRHLSLSFLRTVPIRYLARDNMVLNVIWSWLGFGWYKVGGWRELVSLLLGLDRFPLKGETLALAAGEASISLVLTIGCDERHFLTVCDF